jgi:hypothetical protein
MILLMSSNGVAVNDKKKKEDTHISIGTKDFFFIESGLKTNISTISLL